MFTGIVQTVGTIVERTDSAGITGLVVDMAGHVDGLALGASIALNGTCVTAAGVDGANVTFDLIRETTSLTNLGSVSAGSRVNVERSFRVGDEVGGHILSGHIACAADVSDVEKSPGHTLVRVSIPAEWMAYLMPKGFVALNGASLTIAQLDRQACQIAVSLIPETLARTTFDEIEVGDRVNLEVDGRTQAVVDTVREMLNDDVLLESLKAQ